MKPVEIYTSPLCGYCHAAKRLLDQKGIAFTEIDVLTNPKRKPEMIQRAGGRRTVPQIFIDGQQPRHATTEEESQWWSACWEGGRQK